MALAAVSTPDVAKDLFSGLWDQNENQELYQAYQNMGSMGARTVGASTTSYLAPPDNTIYTTLPSYITATCLPATTCGDQAYSTAAEAVYTTRSTPVFTTAAPAYNQAPSPAYNQAPSPVYNAVPSPVYNAAPSPVYNNCQSPGSSGSCSEANSRGGGASVNEYTKLALLLIAQSQQKDISREEQEKRRLRRERNKIAATKCREKRRAHSANVDKEWDQVSNAHKQLEEEISVLKRERDELARLLDTHCCHNPSLGRSSSSRLTNLSAPANRPTPAAPQRQMFIKSEPMPPPMKTEPGSFF